MATPEYIICLDCETPCYEFEWHDGEVAEALCPICGNEDPTQFATDDDFDALTAD